jgi:hypothetical protein
VVVSRALHEIPPKPFVHFVTLGYCVLPLALLQLKHLMTRLHSFLLTLAFVPIVIPTARTGRRLGSVCAMQSS